MGLFRRRESGRLGAKLGGLAAIASTAGADLARAIGDFASEFQRAQAEPVRGDAMLGPVGGAAVPVDRAMLAQRLMAGR